MVVVVASAGGEPVDPSLATKPADLPAVPRLLGDIVTRADALLAPAGGGGDEQDQDQVQARHELLKKARGLVLALQTPRETMVEHCWAQVSDLLDFPGGGGGGEESPS